MTKTLLVSILIANYNGEKFLPLSLGSLVKHTIYKPFEVLVIDDGSTDKSVEIVKEFQKKHKNIKLLRNKKNLGASASRNAGLKKASGNIIVFLDNDTELTSSWLTNLVSLLGDRSVGASCPKMPSLNDKSRISTAGLKLIPYTGWGVSLGGREKDVGQREKVEDVMTISACMAVKREVIAKIGGFDEKLAVHTEDLDFAWRIWVAGWRIVYQPKSVVYHYAKPQSEREGLMGATKSYILFHINKNTYRSLLKNYSAQYLAKYLPFALLINLFRAVLYLIKLDFSGPSAFIRGIWWNIVNLGDTLRERRLVQGLRKNSDGYIYEKVMVHEPVWQVFTKYYR